MQRTRDASTPKRPNIYTISGFTPMMQSNRRNTNPRKVPGRAERPSGESGYPPEWNVKTDRFPGVQAQARARPN
ncbi:MAG: hypothetical protein Q8N47_26595, partial [Bryobacterales bacterium]|nr:hypothetical protein [Bryobacterales bacterium]